MTEPATSSSSSQIPASEPQPQTNAASKKPIVIVTIGMAGSGKTTFVQRINSYLHSLNPPNPPYILNLDPAVASTPFDANIDIRDTVNYKEVMKQCVLRVFSCSSVSRLKFLCFEDTISDRTEVFSPR